jgi:transaldolase / glucose-6-phosphate isomerase
MNKEETVSRLKSSLPESLAAAVKANIVDWQSGHKMQRLWQRDASLWTGDDEDKWLGWLDITEYQIAHPVELRNLAKEVWSAGFKDVLLLGMGGSSLCPEVLRKTFGKSGGYPNLHVLDSTDPAQIKAFEDKIDIARSLFIVSSKSGSTLEPNIFKQYFFQRTKEKVGADKAGSHFIAITDPGSHMQKVAEVDRFRHIFFGRPSIGGRYSALSNFGMVPAAAIGVDVKKFLDRTQEMVRACGPEPPVEENPGATLGIILGTAATLGRDKVTIITSHDIADLGAWLEQLLAESTGKVGKGIIPVDREELGSPEVYGNDRVFAYVHTEHATDVTVEQKISAIEKAGHPVVRISMADIYDLGAEFFRWEIATAVAGSIIGINAFNQPDVEASKVVTRDLTSQYEKTGSLPPETPVLEDGDIKLFTDEKNAGELARRAGNDKSLTGYLKAHLSRIASGDYFALLAYIQMNDKHQNSLQAIRHAVRDRKHIATCLGFGPRFLHSTGQAYKGGPNSGVFLQITCDDSVQLPVPEQKYTFGVVKAAQARGDFQVLAQRGRRALRVHLPSNVAEGLDRLRTAVEKAIQ